MINAPILITQSRERGVALLIGLVLLLVLSILGLTAVRGTTQQEKMAASSMQQVMSFQGSEAGLHVAMNALRQNPIGILGSLSAPGSTIDYEPIFETGSGLSATATIRDVDELELQDEQGIPAPPVEGFDLTKYKPDYFEIDSIAEQEGTGAVSNQRLGVGIITSNE